jgi:hypothetical protein
MHANVLDKLQRKAVAEYRNIVSLELELDTIVCVSDAKIDINLKQVLKQQG